MAITGTGTRTLETWVAERVAQQPALDNLMHTTSEGGMLAYLVKETNRPDSIATPELKALARGSRGTSLKIPMIDFIPNTVTAGRTCVGPNKGADTRKYTVPFTAYSDTFTILPGETEHNYISRDALVAKKMIAVEEGFKMAIENAYKAILELNKTQILLRSPLRYTFAAGVLSATNTQTDSLLSNLDVIMRANKLNGNISYLGNDGAFAIQNEQRQLGQFNSRNLNAELPSRSIFPCFEIPNAVGDFATMFAVRDLSTAMLFRYAANERNNESLLGGDKEFGTVLLPSLGIEVGYIYTKTNGDYASLIGKGLPNMVHLDCDILETFTFNVDFAIMVLQNQDPTQIPSPIMKVVVKL